MHIVFLNGNEFKGSWQDFMRTLRHPLFVALILGMTGIVFLLGPYDHILPDAVIARVLIVVSSVCVYIATAVAWVAQSRRWAFMAFSFPTLLTAVMVTSLWGVNMSVAAGGQAIDAMQWVQLIAFNIVFCVVGELVLASFLIERIAAETGMKARPILAYGSEEAARFVPPAATEIAAKIATEIAAEIVPEWADILGEKLAIDHIWHIKAEEHYVAVGLRCGRSVLLRGRLADAIAQLPPGAGMQVHRSHWVAVAALAKVWRAREGWRLRLQTGHEVPIARNRTVQARDWATAVLQGK
jgi:hypothetical protein